MVRRSLVMLALVACKSKSVRPHDAQVPRDASAIGSDAVAAPVDATTRAGVRTEHPVWFAAANVASAHLAVGGELVVDARTPAFARYIRFGFDRWKLGVVLGGEAAAQMDAFANLEVPIIPEQAAPTQVTARVFAPAATFVELRVNGRKLKRVALEPGWQTVAASMPRDAMHAGENVIALSSRGSLGLQWLRVGVTHPAADDNPLAALSVDANAVDAAVHAAVDAAAIDLASGASLTWYTILPEGAHVVGDITAPCAIDVGARATDASYAGGLMSGNDDRVDLSAMGGKVVRLSVTARDCPRAHIAQLRVTVNGPAPARLPPSAPPRAVVLLHVATLQGVLDDELARASTVFRQFLWSEPTEPVFTATIHGLATDVDQYIAAHIDEVFVLNADVTSDTAEHVARTIATMKTRGMWDRVMLLVAGPDALVVHDPARFPSGILVDEGADGRDLVPAIRAALGKSPDAPLIALAQGEGRGWSRPSFVHDGATYTLRLGSSTLTVSGGHVVGDVNPLTRRMLTDALALTIVHER